MIGLDTNVLLRLFVEDDPLQSDQARRFVGAAAADAPCVVNPVVPAEFAWTLARNFKKKRPEAARLISAYFLWMISKPGIAGRPNAPLPPIGAAKLTFPTISSPRSTPSWVAPRPPPSMSPRSILPPSLLCRE
jgi:hypothetical protein